MNLTDTFAGFLALGTLVSPGTNPHPLAFSWLAAMVFVIALGLAGFAFLQQRIYGVSCQVIARERTSTALASELEAQALVIRQMSIDLEELRANMRNLQEVQRVGSVWAPDMPVNLNRRGQIMRLSRKGKSVPEIAQDLDVTQGEVNLLLKVHDLTRRETDQRDMVSEKS